MSPLAPSLRLSAPQAQPSAPSKRLNVFPAAVSGSIREAAERYQCEPDTYNQQKTLKVCGCQTSAKDPEMMAYRFLTGDSAPLAAFAKKMREKEIGLVEVVEGSAFKKALGYAFPAELHPQIVRLLDDCRKAQQSDQITILTLVGMLCGQGAEVHDTAIAQPTRP